MTRYICDECGKRSLKEKEITMLCGECYKPLDMQKEINELNSTEKN